MNWKFRHGKYIGSRTDLYGETALIGKNLGPMIEVQFDNLDKFGIDTDERLAFGWHVFPEIDFQIFDEPITPSVPLIFQLIFIATGAFVIFGATSLVMWAFG